MAEHETIDVTAAIDVTEIGEAINKGKDRIQQETKGILTPLPWGSICERIAGEIRKQLGKDMMPWLGKAWTKARELHEFKNPDKYPPGDDAFYNMFPNSVEGVMRTRVTVKCAGEEIGHLPFDVTVTAKFHAAALVIRDARIAGFGGGDYEITLKIALFEKELCEPISLYKSRLPVQVPFEPGLPIP